MFEIIGITFKVSQTQLLHQVLLANLTQTAQISRVLLAAVWLFG